MTFYAQLLQTHQVSLKKRYFKHTARNPHFLYLPLDDWSTLLSGLQTRRNHRKTIRAPRWPLLSPSMLSTAYWVPTSLKNPVKRPQSMLTRYRDVIKIWPPTISMMIYPKPSQRTNSEWPGSSNMKIHLILFMMTLLFIWKSFSIPPPCPLITSKFHIALILLDFWLWGAAKANRVC